jgi:CheY-like chemotaxis protein
VAAARPRAADEAPAPGVARITVADTGAGISKAMQSRIFEPFFSTKEPGKGSGLGLATAERIVRSAGGSISVSSATGRGATFAVELPLVAAREDGAPPEPPGAAAPAPRGDETVLLVEDDVGLRALEQLMLEGAGYRVLVAATAAQALDAVARRRFDVLVVDVVMPGMSGPQLAAELAARGHVFPTVFVSGYGPDELTSRGVAGDATAVVTKPFHGDELLGRVRAVLDAAAARSGRRGRDRRLVRCLACRSVYDQPAAHDLLVRAGCPQCGYLGWTGAA